MIKVDIQMPDSCIACPFGPTIEESPFFDAWCLLLKRLVEEHEVKRRQDDCPLMEVEE